jgi:hypothetical protein
MNERIRELAEQAKIDYELLPEIAREPVWIALDDELEKFAELIISECANAIVNDSRLSDVRTARNGCVRTIKEHFGVEE